MSNLGDEGASTVTKFGADAGMKAAEVTKDLLEAGIKQLIHLNSAEHKLAKLELENKMADMANKPMSMAAWKRAIVGARSVTGAAAMAKEKAIATERSAAGIGRSRDGGPKIGGNTKKLHTNSKPFVR